MRGQKEGDLVHVLANFQAGFGYRVFKCWFIIGYHSVGEGSAIYEAYCVY